MLMKTTHASTTLNPVRPEPSRDHTQGSPNGPIQLVEYGDFECPACGQVYPAVKALKRELGDQLFFAFRHFPLPQHPHAESAAEVAEAAAAQGEFWTMHDALFENQDALSRDTFARLAGRFGLDSQRLAHEMTHGIHRDRIAQDVELGNRAGVNGTPMFYLNGQWYDGDLSPDAILDAVRAGL
jgi:protein-disulfide isomerase